MKPRPTISTFARATHSRTALQCRRNIPIRPALSIHLWHSASQRTGWHTPIESKRHASTSTHPSPKSSYGRQPPPSPKSPNSKKPAKPSPMPPTPAITRTQPVSSNSESSKLNPPPFTYAPDLSVPPRAPAQSYISYLWKCGRAYVTFYKSGVGHVRQTAKLARSLRSKPSSSLTRAEWQIVLRSRRDMLRLPAFGLVFLVCGEWTPLLVMYITPLVPEPVRIPGQVTKTLEKLERRRHERMRGVSSQDGNECSANEIAHTDALALEHRKLYAMSARFDCHTGLWERLGMGPPVFWLKHNVRKKVEYLRRDDELIKRDGGWKNLDSKEVKRACVDRGIDVLGKKEAELWRGLDGWFRVGK